ncbi:MFS transporter [Candidatus Sarmatiella mevalonica]|uniref:MFS transporter n=1 Tax=Candidatus Sarmatiella mevalonica TaxID=2770581 RepID=UPI001920EFF7|nr:MFS transporter [Candidatus Sarmatiella mevalonica]
MKRILILASIGNVLEFYDFLLFGLLTPLFAPIFFPSEHAWLSYLQAYAAFAAGFLTRPFGGWFLGIVGDKFGRKTALTCSMIGMALATLSIGFLPGYASIGVIAPVSLLFFRLIQGISAGGEYHGAGITVLENSESKYKFLVTAVVSASATIGGCLASAVSLMFLLLPLPSWSWRCPFILGGVVGIIGWYARLYLPNTKIEAKDAKSINIFEFSILWNKYLRSSICAIAVAAMSVGPFYTATLFAPSYLLSRGLINKPTMLLMNIASFICLGTLGVLVGMLSRKYLVWKMMMLGAVLVAFCAFPFFWILKTGDVKLITMAQIIFTGVSQLYASFGLGWVLQLFPAQARYRASAFCYNLGVALFCGTIPMISESLIHYTGITSSPAFYTIAVCVIGFLAVFYSKDHYHT